MEYIIENNKGIYLVEVLFSNPKEYSYTWSVGKIHYFERYPNKERLKVLKNMYSKKPLRLISNKINEYSQLKFEL